MTQGEPEERAEPSGSRRSGDPGSSGAEYRWDGQPISSRLTSRPIQSPQENNEVLDDLDSEYTEDQDYDQDDESALADIETDYEGSVAAKQPPQRPKLLARANLEKLQESLSKKSGSISGSDKNGSSGTDTTAHI